MIISLGQIRRYVASSFQPPLSAGQRGCRPLGPISSSVGDSSPPELVSLGLPSSRSLITEIETPCTCGLVCKRAHPCALISKPCQSVSE